jgi:hypothetical protein
MTMKPRNEIPEHLHRKRQREHRLKREAELRKEQEAREIEALPGGPLSRALVRRQKEGE